MGCGESKLAVATSNTILRRKKSSVAGSSKKSEDIETVLESAGKSTENEANSTVQHEHLQIEDKKSSELVKEDHSNNNVGGAETSVVADVNVKDIKVNSKDGDDNDLKEKLDNGNKEEAGETTERLITSGSPNRFFSSRKLEEETIDGIISEGQSGTSDYYTPRYGSKGNLPFKVDDDIAEDDNELALPAEIKASVAETQNNEELVKPEENLVKEAEMAITTSVEAKAVEAKVSTPAEEEKK